MIKAIYKGIVFYPETEEDVVILMNLARQTAPEIIHHKAKHHHNPWAKCPMCGRKNQSITKYCVEHRKGVPP